MPTIAMSLETLLIINKKARHGHLDLKECLGIWQEKGWRIREMRPEQPERIPALIRQYGREAARIVIAGGDGTLNRAAEALVESGRPLGVIPLGTANDFARTMFIPPEVTAACRIIGSERLHKIDLGCVNDKFFFNAAHIGLGEKVAQGVSGQAKQRWGILAYLQSLVRVFRANRHFHLRLTCDGRQEEFRSIQAAVGNGRHYGGGMTVAEDAEIDDHRLNFFSLKPQNLYELAALALALYRGRLYHNDKIISRTGREMEIRTDRQLRIDTDGEVTTRTPAKFKVVDRILAVYVPENFEERKSGDAAE